MCEEEENSYDSDKTIVEAFNIDDIINKYKSNGTEEHVTLIDADNAITAGLVENVEPPLAKRIRKNNKTLVTNLEKNGDSTDVDDMLEQLSKKYNINFEDSINIPKVGSKIPSPIELSDDSNQEPINFNGLENKTDKKFVLSSDDEDYGDNISTQLRQLLRPDYSDQAVAQNINLATTSKEDKSRQKARSQLEKQLKKSEAERAKEIKKALTAANKILKPEECIKNITAFIDEEILKNHCDEIDKSMINLGARYKSHSQPMPNTITWLRKMQSHFIDDEGKLTSSSNDEDVQQMLLILSWQEVVSLVGKNMLLAHIKAIQSVFDNKQLSLGIYGVENYFKFMKSKKNTDSIRLSKSDREYADASKISRRDLEFALTELQIMCSCCYRFLETTEDVGLIVAQFTKSIAQAPYKLEKQENQQQAEWFMSGDNKDCVRVDKDGNGLRRLYQQQLTSFPLARIETAEAIITNYPTVISLIEAYDSCDSDIARDKMVQEIPIRRAAGPLSTVRRIGSELSKRMSTFYNTKDGDVIL